MCVECCWCLCIHKVSFRGASYFFASVHSYDGVSSLLSLVFRNILLRTYFMDSRKTDLDMPDASTDTIELLSKSLYYLATTVTALLIFRAVEKEWRQLMQWSGVVFLTIEAVALGMYFVLHPDSYNSASCLLTLSSRLVFVFFYVISLILYIRQLTVEEKESEWKFQQSEWEPRFLGRSPGGIGALNSGFGSLGFGENTQKWLEKDFKDGHKGFLGTIPHPQLTLNLNSDKLDKEYFSGEKDYHKDYKICKEVTKEVKDIAHVPPPPPMPMPMGLNQQNYFTNTGKSFATNNTDEKFEVRYEVCKSSSKI